MDDIDTLAAIQKVKGILCAFKTDEKILKDVVDEELTVRTTSGMEMENRAMEICFSRDVKICVFCDSTFESSHDESYLLMVDDEDNVVGKSVISSEKEIYENMEGVVWLSDDFIMFPDKQITGDVKMILLPQQINIFADAPEISDAVVFFPSTSTDALLKAYYGISSDVPDTASGIIGFNIR